MVPLTPSDKPQFDGMGQHDLGILRRGCRRGGDLAGDVATAAAALDGQARLAGRACADGAVDGVVRAVLPIRRATGSSARTTRRRRLPPFAAPASCGCPPCTRRALPKRPGAPTRSSGGISDLQFTEAYRVPFQYWRLRAPAPEVRRLRPIVGGRDGHRSGRQSVLRPHRLLRRQRLRLRLLQGRDRARPRTRARAGAGARRLSPADRRQCAAPAGHLWSRRSIVPHVGHRGGDAGGAAGALPHPPLAPGALLRRLSRLVGRRAAGHRQPGSGARDLHPQRHVRGFAARAADAARHRVRPRQSSAGSASERAGRPRTPRWSTARAARNSTRAPTPIGSGSCGPSAPSGTSS